MLYPDHAQKILSLSHIDLELREYLLRTEQLT